MAKANLIFLDGPNQASFYLLSFFSHDKYSTNTINDKSVDGVLGTQTQDGRMVGADKSTELWRQPLILRLNVFVTFKKHIYVWFITFKTRDLPIKTF